MSVRWQHCLDHADDIQNPAESPDCLLGVVKQPTDSRLSETNYEFALILSNRIDLLRFKRRSRDNDMNLVQ